jgi:hypothetical protein
MELKTVIFEHPRTASPVHYNDVANAPLSACLTNGYIASRLERNGLGVEIYDAYLAGDSYAQSCKKLCAMDFNLLGVHAVFFWEHTSELFSLLTKIRAIKPETAIILYGVFPTSAYREILEKNPLIDAVIIGEPEKTFLELAEAFRRNQSMACDRIAGIAFVKDGKVLVNRARPLIDPLDRLDFPKRSAASLTSIGGSILGSRGCHGVCAYCCINPFYGKKSSWRGRSPENIASEIGAVLPALKRKYVYFLDANFFGKGRQGFARALELSERIKEFSVEFGLECRCTDIDEAVLPQMVKAGLRDVFLGIESASEASIKRMHKRVPRNKSEQAVRLLRSLGIEPSPGFIMFEPGSTLEDIRTNFEFLKHNNLLNRLNNTADVLYHREIVLKGMQNYRRLDAAGRLKKKDALGYEGFYCFSGPAVQFLADLMSAVCRQVLKAMDSSQSPICWKKGKTPASMRVNDFVASFFDEVLSRLERQEIALQADQRLKVEDEALTHIEGLIVEERVCQA